MSSKVVSKEQVEDFLSDAASWRLLSLLFQRPTGDWITEVKSVAAEIQDAEVQAAAKSAADANEGEFLHLLGPGGAVSPREVAYRGWEDPARTLSDLNAFYEAFGFSPRTEETADHVSNELAFLSFLEMKQAYARAARDSDNLRVTTDGLSKFVAGHLEGFIEPFADRVRAAKGCYLIYAVPALLALYGRLTSRLSITRGPQPDESATGTRPPRLISILRR